MTILSMKVIGADLVRMGLQNFAREIPLIGRDQIYQAAKRAEATARTYPPERPGQVYIRTYRLQRGFHVSVSGSRYSIVNDVPYTARVKGNAYGQGQESWFIGRWTLLRDDVDREVRLLPPEIERHIKLAAARNNL